MPKASAAKLDEAISEARRITELNLILNDIPGEYGLRLLGGPAGPGYRTGVWLSEVFRDREALISWIHGFLQGWTLRDSRR